MKRGFCFTLIAQQFSTRSLHCRAPFKITLEEGDPRIPQFRNPSFKEEPVVLPEDFGRPGDPPAPAPATEQAQGGEEGGDSGEQTQPRVPIGKVDGIAPDILKQLKKAGIKSALDLADIDPENLKEGQFDLTTLNGVGMATAKKIVQACWDACQAFLQAQGGEEGGDSGEQTQPEASQPNGQEEQGS